MNDPKKCTSCGNVKLLTEFEVSSKTKSRYGSKCKKCRNEQSKRYREMYPEKGIKHARRQKRHAVEIVGKGKLQCNKCGCDKIEILEINHCNGGGGEEMRAYIKSRGSCNSFICDIISGKRQINDLELLCKPCNGIHYLELKYGKLPYKVEWTNNE